MTSSSSGTGKMSILRLRAGLLLLIAFILLCGLGGQFVARQFSLGWGWAILIAVVIWIGVGILLARLPPKVYFGLALVVTLFLAYLVYDFSTGALGWSGAVSALLAVLATALLAFTFYDFQRLKKELKLWIYRR